MCSGVWKGVWLFVAVVLRGGAGSPLARLLVPTIKEMLPQQITAAAADLKHLTGARGLQVVMHSLTPC